MNVDRKCLDRVLSIISPDCWWVKLLLGFITAHRWNLLIKCIHPALHTKQVVDNLWDVLVGLMIDVDAEGVPSVIHLRWLKHNIHAVWLGWASKTDSSCTSPGRGTLVLVERSLSSSLPEPTSASESSGSEGGPLSSTWGCSAGSPRSKETAVPSAPVLSHNVSSFSRSNAPVVATSTQNSLMFRSYLSRLWQGNTCKMTDCHCHRNLAACCCSKLINNTITITTAATATSLASHVFWPGISQCSICKLPWFDSSAKGLWEKGKVRWEKEEDLEKCWMNSNKYRAPPQVLFHLFFCEKPLLHLECVLSGSPLHVLDFLLEDRLSKGWCDQEGV